MTDLGKLLAGAGGLLLLTGLVLWGLGRTGFRGLPGDIRWETENVRVYVPVASMIVLSVVLSAVLWLFQWLGRR